MAVRSKAPKKRQSLLESWIAAGEHEQQDFKFEISNAKKIARSLSAFSNTSGGRLLVGVKDNGVVAGVRSEEELYMLQSAAEMYCRPPVVLQFEEWHLHGKKVLEVKVPYQNTCLVKAPDKEGCYKVYVRVKDQNILANRVYIKYWNAQHKRTHTKIEYTDIEQSLLHLLDTKEMLSKSHIIRELKTSVKKTEAMLVNFMLLRIVQLHITEEGYYYSLYRESV